ncbi:MAG: universal stress protein [Pseudomonadota bacterium]
MTAKTRERYINYEFHEKPWTEAGKKERERVFERARRHLLEAGLDPKRLNTKVITGVSSRAGAIIQEAEEGKYGTVVVGRRGLSKVEEFIMGRVSSKVVHMARDRAVWIVN